MFWFDGSIRNAVDKVKSSGVFLLVFVQGKDSLSEKYETYLNEETKFKLNDFVAIKIPHDSVTLQQFKQIYVSVPVPSVFLIQNNGIPLNVVSSKEISDIRTAINDAVINTKTKEENTKIQLNDLSKKISVLESNEAISKPSQHVRNIGRKLFNISEEELKKRLKEIRGFPKFLLMDSGSRTSSNSPPQSARIQFVLPNKGIPSWEFPDLSTLGDVKAYVLEKMNLSPNFKLVRSYPKTSFTPQDEEKTLAELSLTPTATLIVVPVEDKKVQVKVKNLLVHQSFLSSILNTLLQPLLIVFDYFKKHVFRHQTERQETPRRLPSDTEVEKILNKKTSTSNIHGFKFEEYTDSEAEHPDNENFTQRFTK